MSTARRWFSISECVVLAVGVLTTMCFSSLAVGENYALVDLSVETGSFGIPNDVNDDHVVVGIGGDFLAVRWERNAGRWMQIPLAFQCCFTSALAVSNAGTAVGWTWQINIPYIATVWAGDEAEGIVFDAQAHDINNAGLVVGSNWDPFSGFVWQDGKLSFLGDNTQAFGINDLEQTVGYVITDAKVGPAALFESVNGEWVPTPLGTLGGTSSVALEINNETQIVGWAHVARDLEHAFLWEDGVMIDLGTFGGSESGASDVNDLGQVVGWARTVEEEFRAFIWQDGVMTDLNDLIVSETSLVLTEAKAINELGDIVGVGRTPEGAPHAFLARPLRAGDLNLDAFVDAFDLASLLGSWGPCADCDDCPADLDGDCTVGPLDLAILLGNWG